MTRALCRALAPVLVAVYGSISPAQAAPASAPPTADELVRAVDPARMQATLTALVGFGTRHTLSDTRSDVRGIGAARRWVQGRFDAISADCGGCLQVITPSQRDTGPRVPQPTDVVDVVAVQRGTTEPERVIVITAHIDSRVTDILNATSDAPGANDDASGVAAVLEAARVLSRHPRAATLAAATRSSFSTPASRPCA